MRLIPIIVLLMAGCSVAPIKPKTPVVEVSDRGAVKLDGDTKSAAKVDTKQTDSVLPIPEGSSFVFNEKLGTLTLTVSKATQMALNRKETVVQGPVSHEPPSISDQMDAESDSWIKKALYGCVLIGGAAAIFGLVRGWDFVMYGGGAVLCSGLFGLFVQRHPLLMLLIGVGVALAVAGPLLWHTKIKHLVKNEANG